MTLLLQLYQHTHTHTHRGCYLGVYASLGFSQALSILFGAFSLALAGFFASRTLHSKMLKNILRSPMSFFDTTPLGRILNRFSKDIYMIDEVIPRSLRTFLFTFFSVISTLVVVLIATPTFGVVIVPLVIFYILVQVSYWGERSEPLPSQLNVNSVCSYIYMSWTGSILASKVDALYRVDCYVRVKLAS